MRKYQVFPGLVTLMSYMTEEIESIQSTYSRIYFSHFIYCFCICLCVFVWGLEVTAKQRSAAQRP